MKELLAAITLLLLPVSNIAQQPAAADARPAIILPAHPVSEATLRRYFEACHFVVSNREALEIEFAAQERNLPSWYPAAVWNETVEDVEGIDVLSIALPIYQRYMSEEIAENSIRLFVTPEGQAMVNRVYDKSIHNESQGDSARVAREKAIAAERAGEDAKIHQMLNSMTPAEHRSLEAFMRSADWKRFQEVSPQMLKEFSTAYLAKQELITRQVAEKHKPELRKSYGEFQASHPDSPDTPNTSPK